MDYKKFVEEAAPQNRRSSSIGTHIAREIKAMQYQGKKHSKTLSQWAYRGL